MSVSTVNIGPIPITDSTYDLILACNDSFSRIYDISLLINSIESDIYASNDLTDLHTDDKNSIIDAINSLYDEFSAGGLISSITGVLSNLTTTNKSNLVSAVNELDADIGDLDSLSTSVKSSIVLAMNEIYAEIGGLGDLTELDTGVKQNLVGAINEVYEKVGVSSLSTTATNLSDAVNELYDSHQSNLNKITSLEENEDDWFRHDGSVVATGNFNLGSRKITSLADGVNSQDAVNVSQVQTLAKVGYLTTLNTNSKSTVVSAINEVNTNTVKKTSSTGSAIIPSGTTANRDASPKLGYFRYNESTDNLEVYRSIGWYSVIQTTVDVQSLIDDSISDLVGSAPSDLNTLEEIANAIGNDPDFATTITGNLSALTTAFNTTFDNYYTKGEIINGYLPLSGGTLTGRISTSDNIVSGEGSGGVALTINDSQGNANVTFNHENGIPEQDGNSARIVHNSDATSGSKLSFELASNVSEGVSVSTTEVAALTETGFEILGNVAWHAGNDGSGSGLDAGLLEGHQASYFAATNTTTAQNADTLPIGSHVLAYSGSTTYSRNQSVTLYLSSSFAQEYCTAASGRPLGNALTGTWRYSGSARDATNSLTYNLFRRVA